MILDSNRYQEIMTEKGLTVEEVSKRTGLTLKSVKWIFTNGYSSIDAQERLASVLEVPVSEVVKEESMGFEENVIEFTKGAKTATLSLSQGRYISKIKKLAERYPNECEIVAENKIKDSSICAHVPVSWIKIIPPRKLTEVQKKELVARLVNPQATGTENE